MGPLSKNIRKSIQFHEVATDDRQEGGERPDQHEAGDGRGAGTASGHPATEPYRILAASLLIRSTRQAAPKPLSMFTTAIPGTHVASIVRSAAKPPSETP
jgi:hypothetical protein